MDTTWHALFSGHPVFLAFCLVAALQLLYLLMFFSRLALYRKKTSSQQQTHPVSVVVCARDEARHLREHLPALLTQDYPSTHEVLVVNDNSFDDTKYILDEFRRTYRQLHVIELTQEAKLIPGKKFPLSMGIKSAKHEIVLLTDADCVPATHRWISSMQSAYDDRTEIVLGYSPYRRQPGLLNRLIRWETYHAALQYLSYALAGIPYMGVGRNLSYRKSLFMRMKGFSAHHHIPGGDDDLFVNMAANRRNTRICIDPDSFMLSEPASQWTQWMRQKQRHYSTGKYYRPAHKILLGLYSLTQFLIWPLFIASLLLGPLPLTAAIGAGRLLLTGLMHYRVASRLGETDLVPWFPLFELSMPLYYLLFFPALFKKPSRHWH